MKFNEFSEEFIKQAECMNISVSIEKIEKFYKYMNLLLDWNEKINLTAITNPKEVIIKHFIDSIIPANIIENDAKIIDVGTGAGFPGIPLKIFNESYNITLLDSLNKRTVFLQEVVSQLNLKNVQIIHGRAEDFAQDKVFRAQYDYAISRAVAPLNILLEYLVPYTKVNGKVIALKGSSVEEELKMADNALKKLDTNLIENKRILLPENSGERYVLVLEKNKQTSAIYPRKAGTPKKSPL